MSGGMHKSHGSAYCPSCNKRKERFDDALCNKCAAQKPFYEKYEKKAKEEELKIK